MNFFKIMYMCIDIYIYACLYAHVNTYSCEYIHVCIACVYIYVYIHIYEYIYMCIHIHIHKHIYIYIYIYVYIYIRIYIYIHICIYLYPCIYIYVLNQYVLHRALEIDFQRFDADGNGRLELHEITEGIAVMGTFFLSSSWCRLPPTFLACMGSFSQPIFCIYGKICVWPKPFQNEH